MSRLSAFSGRNRDMVVRNTVHGRSNHLIGSSLLLVIVFIHPFLPGSLKDYVCDSIDMQPALKYGHFAVILPVSYRHRHLLDPCLLQGNDRIIVFGDYPVVIAVDVLT